MAKLVQPEEATKADYNQTIQVTKELVVKVAKDIPVGRGMAYANLVSSNLFEILSILEGVDKSLHGEKDLPAVLAVTKKTWAYRVEKDSDILEGEVLLMIRFRWCVIWLVLIE